MSVVGSLDPAGPAARDIARLWWLMFALGVAMFLVVVVLLVGGILRRRSERGSVDERRPGSEAPSVRRWLVVGGVAMPVAVLLVVFAATLHTMRDAEGSEPGDALVVEVIGHQWWWEVRYPDEGFTTANELHLPLGRTAVLRLSSADVIHSLWVPSLAGKMDLLPDGVNTLVLEADEPGVHHSECAEFCGVQHARMRLIVVAETPEAFRRWVDRQRRPASAAASPEAERGRGVFAAAGCAWCHTVRDAYSSATEAGPDLTHLASREFIGAGALPNTRDDLLAWVTDPHDAKTGVHMPATMLSEDDLAALIAYLRSLE